MGDNISVFEQDQLEKDLEILSKDESLSELFHRSLSDMTAVLTKPKRLTYDTSTLSSHQIGCQDYQVREYEVYKGNINLHLIKWIRNTSRRERENQSQLTIIYLHTNGRAASDAIEILPLCDILDANLISFDCRGCGKSGGLYSLSNSQDLSDLIDELLLQNPDLEIILWGRGIGTNSVFEYANYSTLSKNVKFIVLDSPFTSLYDVVYHSASSIDTGIVVPSVFVKFAMFMMRKSVKSQLGTDPYEIRPISLANQISVPCYILSADEDDYIPDNMGQEIAQHWKGKCWYRVFPGGHVGERDPGIVMSTIDKILPFVNIPQREDALKQIAESQPDSNKVKEVIKLNLLHSESIDIMERESVYVAPIWKADSSSTRCELCQSEFSVMIRRHHCRNCGSLVCHSCSKRKLLLPNTVFDPTTPVRVCDVCYDGMTCQLSTT